jgi:hypothetical protein
MARHALNGTPEHQMSRSVITPTKAPPLLTTATNRAVMLPHDRRDGTEIGIDTACLSRYEDMSALTGENLL